MRVERLLMVFSVLLLAALACNLPVGQNSNQPNLAGTITAQALLLQTPSNTTAPANTAPPASTATPAVPEASMTAAPANNPQPSVPTAKPTKTPGLPSISTSTFAPLAPTNFHASVSCTSSGQIFTKNVHVVLTWNEASTNLDGLYVGRNLALLTTLPPNSLQYVDTTTLTFIPILGKTPPPPPAITIRLEHSKAPQIQA